jgi:hypothetical protein
VRRRSGRSALAALTTLVLGACATVPTSGPIRRGPIVEPPVSTQFVRVIAAPPSAGADPAEIVRGFIEAGASIEQDHAIARRYLADEAALTWDAGASTTTYDQESLEVKASGARARVSLEVTGRLAADGSLTPVEPPRPRRVDVTLEKISEDPSRRPEWRITDPAPGILISDADLLRAYRPYQAHFMSARGDVLVPDPRLVPVVGPSLPSALAQRVLAGPSAWLAPAVRPIPPGVALALGSVPVVDGVARVELNAAALAASDDQRRDLAAALTWTLTQLPDIAAVRLLVGGEDFPVPGVALQMDRRAWASRAPDAAFTGAGPPASAQYVLEDSAVVQVDGPRLTSTDLPAAVGSPAPGLAVSLDRRTAAVIRRDRRSVVMLPLAGSARVVRLPAERARAMSFDIDGALLYSDAGRVLRAAREGPARPVEVAGDLPVDALSLARDGARAALVSGGRVYVGVLEGTPRALAITSLHQVDRSITAARDLAWRDATTLEVLGSRSDGSEQVLRVVLGSGQVQPLGAPALGRDVAAAPGAGTLVVSGTRSLFVSVGPQWREAGRARSVAYPG